MSVTDAEYRAWLQSSTSQPVTLVEIDAEDDAGSSVLRLSTARYRRTTDIYRARLRDYEMTWSIEPGVAGFSEIRYGDLRAVNIDGALDAWRDKRMSTCTVRHGDRRWDYADLRQIFKGRVFGTEADSNELVVTIRDRQAEADLIVEDITVADDTPGKMLKALLVTHGPYALADVDEPAIDALDTDYPYTCTLDTDGRKNILDLADTLLTGLPVDYGPGPDGIITIYTFAKPAGSSTHRALRPLAEPDIERIAPIGEITVRRGTAYESTREDTTTKADYADWRSETLTVAMVAQADAEAVADARLSLFDRPYDRITIETKDDVHELAPGDEVPIEWARYGYDAPKHGRITSITQRHLGNHELEAFV